MLGEYLGPGLVILYYREHRLSDYDRATWSHVKVRKRHQCKISERVIECGELAYAPVGNQMYRGHRLAPEVVDMLLERGVPA